jgi:hypothetical protein
MSGDGARCSWYQMDKAVDEDFYIEAALIEELSKYEDVSSYILSKAWAHFKSESGVTFSARRVIPLELLPFRAVFEEFQNGVRIRIPADLRSSIETVNIVNEGEQGADKWVKLIISDETITCKAETKKGTIFEEVPFEKPINLDGVDKVQLSINPLFLMDVLEKATFMYFSDRAILFKRQAFQHMAMLLIT